MTDARATKSTTSVSFDAADPRPAYEAAADQLERLVAAVTPDRLDAPTPCPEWDVRALLEHVVDGTHRTARLGEEGDGASMLQTSGQDVADGGWVRAYAEARVRFRAAWEDAAKLDGTYTVPWGVVPGRGVIGAEVQETVMHAWDLARALGRSQELPEEPASSLLPFSEQILPAERRGGPVPFEPVRTAPEGADAHTRLAAWLGRDVT